MWYLYLYTLLMVEHLIGYFFVLVPFKFIKVLLENILELMVDFDIL